MPRFAQWTIRPERCAGITSGPALAAVLGILTTAGNLLFTGDTTTNLVAFNATTGAILWHAGLGNIVTNGPITYELDGLQYIVAAAGDTLYAFVLR